MRLQSLAERFVDVLYPPRCAGCGGFGRFFCDECAAACTPAQGTGRCAHCAAAWDGADNCPRCFRMQDVDHVRAAFEMDGAARRAVHRLKYSRVRAAASEMAEHLRPLCDPLEFDFAAAVPLHRARQRHRGFNQANELLRPLQLPALPGGLARTVDTVQQVGNTFAERQRNIASAFAYTGPELAGARILLVDDVVTTGATANACARVLRAHGAAAVIAIAFARKSYDPTSTAAIDD